jgi:hypothetical protein
MGFDAATAASGIRLSLGDWHAASDLFAVPEALMRARMELSA